MTVCVFVVQRCEKLALQLYSHTLSGPFQQPVSPLVSLMDQPVIPRSSRVLFFAIKPSKVANGSVCI